MEPMKIGDVTVTCHVERSGPVRTAAAMFPSATAEEIEWAIEQVPEHTIDRADEDKLVINYQSYVLKTPSATVMIDCCVGEHAYLPPMMQYDKTPYLQSLAAAGVTFDDIDFVFCTHMHVDHVGWNTRLLDGRIVPTFPNAKYIFARAEYSAAAQETGFQKSIFDECVKPIVDAGQATLVDGDFVLNDLLTIVPTPGHSPGHICVKLDSLRQQALFCGDLMHHAIQCVQPDWHTIFCADPAAAVRSRREILKSYASTDTVFFPAHFPDPVAGLIRDAANGWRYQFLAG
jgi:glyoxylase-like metal-dependent hydrolase (beta-lactamase superfamily II)